jgi:uncharacterized protein YjbI with pentapeptide repeats
MERKKEIIVFSPIILLDALKHNKNSVDIYGNVTVDTLGTYVYDAIMNLPIDKRPSQKPIRKMEAGGRIVRAHYPELEPKTKGGETVSIDEQLLKLLLEGEIVEFNKKRRQEGSDARLSLRDANLVGLNLFGANLNGADLSNAALNNADLRQADLSNADLTKAHLNEANLIGARLVKANLSHVNLYHANLDDVDLTKAHLNEANLIGARLVKANLMETDLSDSNLVGSNLSYANFDKANLSHAKLMFADIAHAENFDKANLKGSELIKQKIYPFLKGKPDQKGQLFHTFE